MHIVILLSRFGTRLSEETEVTHKSLAKIRNKPNIINLKK